MIKLILKNSWIVAIMLCATLISCDKDEPIARRFGRKLYRRSRI